MAILTLTPSRFANADGFFAGSYAYIMADRPVRRLGDLITPEPLSKQVFFDGDLMTFDLVPNALADDNESFAYTLGVYDPAGKLMYQADFVMPDTDSDIFDILPVPQDPNACIPANPTDNSQ